ncbi:MAG: phosphoribosylanthranilate isomerase [Clostridia bacterium]
MTKIKLCGLRRPEDIETANKLKPEYIGFVFFPKSKRYVSEETAKKLKKQLNSHIRTVGVFVNERPEVIAGLAEKQIIDMIQLHGGETEETIRQLRALTSCPIIKAFSIGKETDIDAARNSTADYVLLDHGKGGTGTAFNWALAKKLHRPCFLAGGLNLHNIHDALNCLSPFAVDVSSGIETDGVKDPEKMKAFVSAVREISKERNKSHDES